MNFTCFKIEDYDKIWKYCAKNGENSTQHSFVNFFSLEEKYGTQYSIVDRWLILHRSKMSDENYRVYLFPMGDGEPDKAIEAIMDDAHQRNAKVCFNTVTKEKRDWIMKSYPGKFRVEEIRDYAEYIHLSEKLANLPGKDFAKKRYDVNLFRRTYKERMEEVTISQDNMTELLEFEKEWLQLSRNEDDYEDLLLEYREIEKHLKYYEQLNISGFILRIDGKIQGFVYGTPISDECYDVLIEKGNREFNDVYRILHQDIVRLFAMNYKYINREEDVGVPGLRKAKLSYKPDILLEKYILTEI